MSWSISSHRKDKPRPPSPSPSLKIPRGRCDELGEQHKGPRSGSLVPNRIGIASLVSNTIKSPSLRALKTMGVHVHTFEFSPRAPEGANGSQGPKAYLGCWRYFVPTCLVFFSSPRVNQTRPPLGTWVRCHCKSFPNSIFDWEPRPQSLTPPPARGDNQGSQRAAHAAL